MLITKRPFLMKCRSCYILCLTVALSTVLLGRNYSVWSDKLTKALYKKFGDFINKKSALWLGQLVFSSVYVLYIWNNQRQITLFRTEFREGLFFQFLWKISTLKTQENLKSPLTQ